MKNIDKFNRAIQWIHNNTVDDDRGIAVTNRNHKLYPEVTGYYIPSLLQWGKKDLAISFAKHLCEIQKKDGSWFDSDDRAPYIFDSAQILKGLISIRDILPFVDEHIISGVNWILGNMQENGRLITPDSNAWGKDDSFCNELVHIYCLKPIADAGNIFDVPEYIDKSEKILDYYVNNYKERILNFSLFAHFYAYVMEGLIDMNRSDIAAAAMKNLIRYTKSNGAVYALNNVSWVCSTSLFQLALVWYKLGDRENGDRTFNYAATLQNKSGGWYGSYPTKWFDFLLRGQKKANYFPDEEISWATKYYLDALFYQNH